MKWIVAVMMTLITAASHAQVEEPATSFEPFFTFNMTLELDGVERAIDDTRHSLDQVGLALVKIAESDNLTAAQQQQLDQTIDNLNQLVVLSRRSVESLPQAYQDSKQVLASNSEHFLSELRQQMLLLVGLVGVIVIALIVAIAWFILRPVQHTVTKTTRHLFAMAEAIQTTAQSLESISNQQQRLAVQLEQQQHRCDPHSTPQ
ncbi:hypothetical protein FCU94_18225 [Vibrio sp. JPW-9-11-11]|uniref:hypothetical protein n=1 Tax=Vibrio sp. JPW-9-11-11 TaxID=1416532 RepID=UPI0015948FA1|nr:hypothetical protein [Vibrio sp. JPW-9-11-11]NVD08787.1 hypothetical protein [Vibrio sp. JPW-9-11-11]